MNVHLFSQLRRLWDVSGAPVATAVRPSTVTRHASLTRSGVTVTRTVWGRRTSRAVETPYLGKMVEGQVTGGLQ